MHKHETYYAKRVEMRNAFVHGFGSILVIRGNSSKRSRNFRTIESKATIREAFQAVGKQIGSVMRSERNHLAHNDA